MGLFNKSGKPAWVSDKEDKVLKAIAKVKSQEELAQIAMHKDLYRSYKVAKAVIERITDDDLLYKIAVHYLGMNHYFSITFVLYACHRITNKDKMLDLQRAITRALTPNSITSPTPNSKDAALLCKYISEQDLLLEIVNKSAFSSPRLEAANRIADPALRRDILFTIAFNSNRGSSTEKEVISLLGPDNYEAMRSAKLGVKHDKMINKGDLEELIKVLYSDSGASDEVRTRALNQVDIILEKKYSDIISLMDLYDKYTQQARNYDKSWPQHTILTKIKSRLDRVLTTTDADRFITSKLPGLAHNQFTASLFLAVGKAGGKVLADLASSTNVEQLWAEIRLRVKDETFFFDKIKDWYDITFFKKYNEMHPLSVTLWTSLSAHKEFYKLDIDTAAKAIADSNDIGTITHSLMNMKNARLAEKLLVRIDKDVLSSLYENADDIINDANIDPTVCIAFINALPIDCLQGIKGNDKVRQAIAENIHEKHGNSNWNQSGKCRLICDVCGIGKWNHNYEITASQGYDDSDDMRFSFTEYTCRKCDERIRVDWQGGKKNEGYFLTK